MSIYGNKEYDENDVAEQALKKLQEQATEKTMTTYRPSAAVTQAQQQLQSQMAQKPGAYQSQWQTQLNDTISKILNREKFNFDLNGNALWDQYKDSYTRQGKMAMMDTMGQAAALTGGYGNSYAQSVGQQAYQGYMQQLNDKIPELYQLALDMYNQEGDALLNQYGILSAQEDADYGRHRDAVGDWESETSRLQNQYYTELDFDYGKSRDEVSDSQWQAEFDEALRRWNYENGIGVETGGTYRDNPTPEEAVEDGDPGEVPVTEKTFHSVGAELDTWVRNGMTGRDAEEYLTAQRNAGYISDKEYEMLKKGIRPVAMT